MKAAKVIDGRVVNIIEVESLVDWPGYIDAGGAWIGCLWDGTIFSADPVTEAEQEAAVAARAIDRDVEADIIGNTIYQVLKTKTAAEINTWVQDQFSALAGMSETAIEDYIDANVTDLGSARSALKIIGKDLAQTMRILKVIAKITVYLAKQSIREEDDAV